MISLTLFDVVKSTLGGHKDSARHIDHVAPHRRSAGPGRCCVPGPRHGEVTDLKVLQGDRRRDALPAGN